MKVLKDVLYCGSAILFAGVFVVLMFMFSLPN